MRASGDAAGIGAAAAAPRPLLSAVAPAMALAAALAVAACGGDGRGGEPRASAGGAPAAGDASGAPSPGDPGPLADLREVPPPAADGSGQPRLSVGPDGTVRLSWLQPAGDRHELVFAELDGDGWSPARRVVRAGDLFVNWADLPSVVATGDGSLAAHWLESTGPGPYAYGVRVAFSRDGGRSWSAPVAPHRDGTPTEHGFVSLLPADGGGVRAVWLDGRRLAGGSPQSGDEGAAMTLRSAVVAPGGDLREPALVDGRVCDCCQTSAAATARGPLVVYRDRSQGETRDVSAVRLEDGGWTAPRPVHRDGWTLHACPVNGPAVDARGGERAAVAWFTAAGGRPRVQVAFTRDAGETFGPPTRVDGGDPVGRVDVVLLEGGDALVSWVERGEPEDQIRVRRVRRDGGAGPAGVPAAASAARAGGFPRMVAAAGRVVMAWTDPSDPGRVRAVVGRLPSR